MLYAARDEGSEDNSRETSKGRGTVIIYQEISSSSCTLQSSLFSGMSFAVATPYNR